MANGKVKQNLIFQTFYQILIVITPLITSPYVSRILGAEGLGIYSYTYSITNYFAIAAMLGTNLYGSKIIASIQEDKRERSKVFIEIMSMQMMITLLGMVGYTGYLFFVRQEDYLVSCIQILMIFSCLFNVNWFFFGLEEFKVTASRNMIIKVITIIFIFLFVREEGDLWKYVLILAGGECISQVSLFILAQKYIQMVKPTWNGIIKHLKPNLILFVPGIAFALNHDLDKTLIGLFSNYEETGFYYNAEKLIKIPSGIITGIGVVLLPYMTRMVVTEEEKISHTIIRKSITPILFLTIALCGGIISICPEFVPIFFGSGYEECIVLINIMAVTMVFSTIANIIRTQYLIPNNKDREYSILVIIGAIINCCLNIVLIMAYGAKGAAIATLIAELFVCAGHVWLIEKYVKIHIDLLKSLIFVIPVTSMYFAVRIVSSNHLVNGITLLIVEILLGGAVYLLVAVPCLRIVDRNLINVLTGNLSLTLWKRKK